MDSRAPRRTLCGMSARTPEEVHALLEAALNARDADAFAAVFEPDATMIPRRTARSSAAAPRSARRSNR